MSKVIVASTNPVKIEAVRLAFAKMLPEGQFEFEGLSVPSGVADQPMTDAETYQGARNRVETAKSRVEADYYVGLEGGLEKTERGMEAFAWMVVLSGDGRLGEARTSSFILPAKVAALIEQGKELGEADDIVFGQKNSKQANGAVGILTANTITRTTYYTQAMILALIPFKHPDLY